MAAVDLASLTDALWAEVAFGKVRRGTLKPKEIQELARDLSAAIGRGPPTPRSLGTSAPPTPKLGGLSPESPQTALPGALGGPGGRFAGLVGRVPRLGIAPAGVAATPRGSPAPSTPRGVGKAGFDYLGSPRSAISTTPQTPRSAAGGGSSCGTSSRPVTPRGPRLPTAPRSVQQAQQAANVKAYKHAQEGPKAYRKHQCDFEVKREPAPKPHEWRPKRHSQIVADMDCAPEEVTEKLYQYASIYRKKLQARREAKAQEEAALLKVPDLDAQFNSDEFYQKVMAWKDFREKNLDALKDASAEKPSFQPEIDDYSRELATAIPRPPVWERVEQETKLSEARLAQARLDSEARKVAELRSPELTDMATVVGGSAEEREREWLQKRDRAREALSRACELHEVEGCTFQPQLVARPVSSIGEQASVHTRLHEDALRRQGHDLPRTPRAAQQPPPPSQIAESTPSETSASQSHVVGDLNVFFDFVADADQKPAPKSRGPSRTVSSAPRRGVATEIGEDCTPKAPAQQRRPSQSCCRPNRRSSTPRSRALRLKPQGVQLVASFDGFKDVEMSLRGIVAGRSPSPWIGSAWTESIGRHAALGRGSLAGVSVGNAQGGDAFAGLTPTEAWGPASYHR